MARLTSEIAATQVGSKYDLVLIAARRARELNRGWSARVSCDNGASITALREIEVGLIGRDYLLKPQNIDKKERPPRDDHK